MTIKNRTSGFKDSFWTDGILFFKFKENIFTRYDNL